MSGRLSERQILTEAQDASPGERVPGFMAMEYYALILNRTYAVFVQTDGLYGWKVIGPVGVGNPTFFLPYQETINDLEGGFRLDTVQKLAGLPGGFFVRRAEIANVEFNPTAKWGMGGIPHSGRVEVSLAGGGKREFILLGQQDGKAVRELILNGKR